MSQAKWHICMLRVRPNGRSYRLRRICLKRNATLCYCGSDRVAAHTDFRKDVSTKMQHFRCSSSFRMLAVTDFREDVSSKMQHCYVAGAPEWPLPLILKRMSQAKCYSLILRVRPSPRSYPFWKGCLNRNATFSMLLQLPDSHSSQF